MKRSKFSEEQVAYALRQAESGTAVGDVCRQVGISEATFYAWKKKYAHLRVSELRRLRQIEEENTRLKRLVADLSLDKHMLSEALRKKSDARTAPRAGWLVSSHLPGQLRAGLPTRAVQSRGLVSKESEEAKLRLRGHRSNLKMFWAMRLRISSVRLAMSTRVPRTSHPPTVGVLSSNAMSIPRLPFTSRSAKGHSVTSGMWMVVSMVSSCIGPLCLSWRCMVASLVSGGKSNL